MHHTLRRTWHSDISTWRFGIRSGALISKNHNLLKLSNITELCHYVYFCADQEKNEVKWVSGGTVGTRSIKCSAF